MAEVQPFVALLFNPQTIRMAEVITEPYDKITPSMQQAYYRRHPNNIVRITLGLEEEGDTETRNKYSRAAQWFQDWKKQGTIITAPERAVFTYRQTYELPGGRRLARRALIARVRLCEYGPGSVLPHEHTLAKPKADRLNLLRATHAHFGQIFLLYEGDLDWAAVDRRGEPVYEFQDDSGIEHRLRSVSDPRTIESVSRFFGPRTLYIADGHHRYETALAFRDEQRRAFPDAGTEAPHEFVMATLVNIADPGLCILPTHRLVENLTGWDEVSFLRGLDEWFVCEPQQDLASLLDAMRRAGRDDHWLGMMLPAERFSLLKLRTDRDRSRLFADRPPLWEDLDVALLHVLILERLLGIDDAKLREETHIRYFREPEVAARLVLSGKGQLAFYLNPTRVDQVKAVADARSRMPQKSTDFYPKLPSGLVMYAV